MKVIVYTAMNGFPARIYCDPNTLLADMRKKFPGAEVKLMPDKKGDHRIEITGVRNDNGPLGLSIASYTLGFRVLEVEDPQNWGNLK